MLKTLINNIPDRIYAKDTSSRFIFCNNSLARRMEKTDPSEIIGKSDFDLLPRDLAGQFYENEQEIIRTGKSLVNHEEPMGNITGEIRWNLATKVPLKDKDGNITGIIGIGRDITERKQAEEENRQKTILLQSLNAEKDKFFSILAHDLRGPLGSFLGATQVLSEEIHSMSVEDIRNIASSMRASATNVYNLLENLLEWSKLKQNRMDFIPESFNLKTKISECIEQTEESAKRKNIKLSISVPDTLIVFADPHMFESVIRNLVSNAVKFTPAGGNISIAAKTGNIRSTEISITDTGIGMSADMVSKLFLLNEKISRKGTDGEPSSGLGLLLCKEFIEKHGGVISLKSEVGIGTTFLISLPLG